MDLDCDGVGDPWFNEPYDCFANNPWPQWGIADPSASDDPQFSLADDDGAGPENLDLESPQGSLAQPLAYPIAVHAWHDHGFGPSFATVRVFVQGLLAFSPGKVKLQPRDLWTVGKLNWPNKLTGGKLPVVSTCYQSGDACLGQKDPGNPKGGKLWQQNGLYCMTPCYGGDGLPGLAGAGPLPANCAKAGGTP